MKKLSLTLVVCLLPTGVFAGPPEEHEIPNARPVFDEVTQLVEKHYVDADLTQEKIWSHAVHGVLDRLIQTKKHRTNVILSPDELKELKIGLSGKLSGVGVIIEIVQDILMVRGVVDGGPADKAGIQAGDRILAINGQPTKGQAMLDVVKKIRGPTGTTVDLLLQRDVNEWTQPITRGTLKIESVVTDRLPGNVAYIHIRNFAKDTVKLLDKAIKDAKGAKGLILDLRGCPGGLLEASLTVADRFLKKGVVITTLKKRGDVEEVMRAKEAARFKAPIVVLINEKSASSAELLAAALAENDRATLVGTQTLGKGTVEKLMKLQNGWGLKLSVARFYSPKGNYWQGKGVTPDFPVPSLEGKQKGWSAEAQLDLEQDPQLKTATSVLKFLNVK